MLTPAFLPASLAGIDLGNWAAIPPEDLLDRDGAVPAMNPALAIAYARAGPTRSYSEIGFRMSAASPHGPVPVRTVDSVKFQRSRDAARDRRLSEDLDDFLVQQKKLAHRPIDLPRIALESSARFRYTVDKHYFRIQIVDDTADTAGEPFTWLFPLTAPPKSILDTAVADDAPLIHARSLSIDLPALRWLPFSALLEMGKFERMQNCRERLSVGTLPQNLYLFLSHRWLSVAEPDPEGLQARFVAWQLFSYLCDAVRIARYRGLHEPRKIAPSIGCQVGINGPGPSETIIVNVLRSALDEALLEQAFKESRAVESIIHDFGIEEAKKDVGLRQLAATVSALPVLAALLDRIHLWYDYSCLPQSPRTPEEDRLFRAALSSLTAAQVLGRTIVVLDEPEDYFSRAWCTLEAIVAASRVNGVDLLVGSQRRSARTGLPEIQFEQLIDDMPHLVWRAFLDTELFRVQTSAECMARLGLQATDPNDLPFLYDSLRTVAFAAGLRVDPSELLTGVFPFPMTSSGNGVFLPPRTGVALHLVPEVIAGLDWSSALKLGEHTALVPPFVQLAATHREPVDDRPSCHLAVFGSCEGEASLLAAYALDHYRELENLLDFRVESLSWLSCDVAPVGYFIHGSIEGAAIDSRRWVILAPATRLRQCGVVGALKMVLVEQRTPCFQLAIDQIKDNVAILETSARAGYKPDAEDRARTVARPSGFPSHPGGLFRESLFTRLLLASPGEE